MWYDNGMRRGRAGGVAAAAALALAAAAPAANVPSTTYVDKAGGYAITIPRTWQLVPRTVPQIDALIARLKKKQSTADLASFYAQLIATPQQRQQLGAYVFQAFDWPASLSLPLPIEVSVGIVRSNRRPRKSTLPPCGDVATRRQRVHSRP